MKVTTEKLPKSLVALDIELDREQVEKGLDRAARRLSQKHTIPGFRKGKAPRFIIENYFGRPALVEEASEELVNKAFKEALDQQQIEPVGPASLEDVNLIEEPYRFRVTVPVEPTVTLADYRAIRVPLEIPEVTDEMLSEAMDTRRERHVVLRDLEEPRPAALGDQLTVQLDAFVDGQLLDEREEGTPAAPSTLVLDAKRLAPGLAEAIAGAEPGQMVEKVSHMPEDHPNERVRDKDVRFQVLVQQIQERLLPEWEELPTLEEFEGTLEELREKTRQELVEAARETAERDVVDSYITRLVGESEFDLPEVLIEREADRLLRQREYQQFERYGVKAEQVYKIQNRNRDDLVAELLPQGEERLKVNLALREVIRGESLQIEDTEIDAEVGRLVEQYEEAQRDRARLLLSTELRSSVASNVLDKKLRDTLLAIAIGASPAIAANTPATHAASEEPGAAEAETETAAETPSGA